MTISELVGCGLMAFGPAVCLFSMTVAQDPVRIIIMIAAAFCWLLSLLLSSILWFAVVPLRSYLAFGMFFSVLFQELFRYGVYRLLRRTENDLRQIADSQLIIENKHVFAYVSGMGFGVISGAFAFVNVLADSVGPATVGLKSGSDAFFITSALTTLCMILLHTFWSVIFFNALDEKNYLNVSWVVVTHLVVSGLTLLNRWHLYYASILPAYIILVITIMMAYKSIGGSWSTFKKVLPYS
ncbi:gamma-secretase subunit Aph-1 [Arctopsyche grandis]|uniref:gamma-secretase subunit Aph-1 n=1 Tax=Arctopsyche grandis TaxID=121162 RepID=UPI00406D9459